LPDDLKESPENQHESLLKMIGLDKVNSERRESSPSMRLVQPESKNKPLLQLRILMGGNFELIDVYEGQDPTTIA